MWWSKCVCLSVCLCVDMCVCVCSSTLSACFIAAFLRHKAGARFDSLVKGRCCPHPSIRCGRIMGDFLVPHTSAVQGDSASGTRTEVPKPVICSSCQQRYSWAFASVALLPDTRFLSSCELVVVVVVCGTHANISHSQHGTHNALLLSPHARNKKSQIISTAAQLRLSTALTTCRDG